MHHLVRAALPFAAALSIAVPAGAQIVARPTYEPVPRANPFLPDSRLPGPGIHREIADVRDRIADARDDGRLSRREARRLDREARLIGHLARRYARDGLSAAEERELRARAGALRGLAGRP